MKQISTLFIYMLFHCIAFSQPVITAAAFPTIGDSINAFTELNPNISISAAGANQTWDFSRLNGVSSLRSVFDDAANASAAAGYPEADLFVSLNGTFERFYRTFTDRFVEIGSTSLDPITSSIFLNSKFTSPYVLQRAPMRFGDINRMETSIVSSFLFSDLPDTLISRIPKPHPDSIRITVFFERHDTVDAWGALQMPNGENYTVLREKRAQTRRTMIETYLSFFGWIDNTVLIRGFFPDLDVFDPQTTTSFMYLNEDLKQPVAVVTLDSNGVVANVQYQGGTRTSTFDLLYNKAYIQVSPNPSYGKVKFTLTDFPFGKYELKVFSILGKVLWQKDIEISSEETTIKKNLSYLAKGTYLFSISDEPGHIISTKRLVVLKP